MIVDHMTLHTSRDSIRRAREAEHSSYTEEKHWNLQALTEEMKCNLI